MDSIFSKNLINFLRFDSEALFQDVKDEWKQRAVKNQNLTRFQDLLLLLCPEYSVDEFQNCF